MRFAFDDEQDALRDSAVRLFGEKVSLDRLLEDGADPDTSYDQGLWATMADLGWTGLLIPEEYGGYGADHVTWVVLTEEFGRSLCPAPYLGHHAGTVAVLQCGSEDQKRRVLPDVAAGATQLALAWLEDDIDGLRHDPSVRVVDGRATGAKRYVPDGETADLLVVSAVDEQGQPGLYLIDATNDGVRRERLAWFDLTRQVCRLDLDGAPAEKLGGSSDFTADWRAIQNRIALAVASESIGGSEAVLRMSVEYAKERVAYGRPIGIFQAVKHTCADMLMKVEGGKSLTYYLAWALSSSDADTQSLAASMTKSWCADTFVACTADAIQMHGAIGATWEMPLHLYYKRARANAPLLGTTAEHRDRIVDLVRAGTTGVL